MPKTIGVITSPTGAVIRDVLHRINDRFPLHVIVWPVRVQGETTGAEELDATIASYKARLQSALSRQFEKARSNLLAAQRGLASPDMLLAMPRRRLDEASGRLGRGLDLATRRKRTGYESIAGRLSHRGLSSSIARNNDRLDALSRRANTAHGNKIKSTRTYINELTRRNINAFENKAVRAKARYDQANRLLGSLSYKSILDRGYAVVRNAKDTPIASIENVKSGEAFSVELRDGRIAAVAAGGDVKPQPQKKSAKSKPDWFFPRRSVLNFRSLFFCKSTSETIRNWLCEILNKGSVTGLDKGIYRHPGIDLIRVKIFRKIRYQF
ncbi:Exodeoxyribonuclease 7 large subunit [Nymphon striatum]|nr:Exodeoxyribonuclease 7 large subunit [Nymphon striatum]